jgi:hypothetical protein
VAMEMNKNTKGIKEIQKYACQPERVKQIS